MPGRMVQLDTPIAASRLLSGFLIPMPKYPLKYIVIPPLVIALFMSIGVAIVTAAVTKEVLSTLMFFGLSMWINPMISCWLTGELYKTIDVEVARAYHQMAMETKGMRDVSEPDRIDTLIINTGNEYTRIVGTTKGKWEQWAKIIKAANYSCTARVMGNEYEPFKAAIKDTRYAEERNGLKLTGDGKRMIDKLHSPNSGSV